MIIGKIKKIICIFCLFFLFSFFCLNKAYASSDLHYDLKIQKDLPLTTFALFLSFYGNYRYSQMNVPKKENIFNSDNLPPWDKPFIGRYDNNADKLSDYFAILGLSPILLSTYSFINDDVYANDFMTYSIMFVQALAIQNGINLLVRSMRIWPRPYIYATEGEGYEKSLNANGEAYGSFFSGHVSAAFTVAFFTGEWFSEVYKASPYKGIVWASSLSLASFVGVLRISAGKHYPTDVIAGAFVGSLISISVIKFHKNDKFTLYVNPCSLGIITRF